MCVDISFQNEELVRIGVGGGGYYEPPKMFGHEKNGSPIHKTNQALP